MANVTLKNVWKIYDKSVTAVRDFSLDIKNQEFIVLVGPSGCGKSTTLRMVAGLEEISKGEIYIGDRLVNNVAPKDRDIAMVFKSYALYPHMTVYQNMAFVLKLRHVAKKEIDRKVREAADILGISDLLDRRPKALSGGQRQRVAIGRAIVREPAVFLMDEPLSNLDAKLRNQMRAEIIKIRQRVPTTFIYVTHDQTEAMTLGDRIVIMKDGVIQQIGTPEEVFNHPGNRYVAGFIGSPQMNFFPAALERSDDQYVVRINGATIRLTPEQNRLLLARSLDSRKVIAGVRPEHLRLAAPEAANAIVGKFDVSEMMGSEVYLHVDVGEQKTVIRVQTTQLPENFSMTPGDESPVRFTIPAHLLHLFDAESEVSLLD